MRLTVQVEREKEKQEAVVRKVEARIDRFCWVFCAFFFLLVSAVSSLGATYYVSASRPDDTGDGTSWDTAKKVIQSAVNLAVDGDTVLVTNGVYNTGGIVVPNYTITNRVGITNAITLQSVNGASNTFIVGQADPNSTNGFGTLAVRCLYLCSGTTVSGFTITNGYTDVIGGDENGGGIYAVGNTAVISNCYVVGNSASRSGGGVSFGTLYNCSVIGNNCHYYGGGIDNGTLYNCVIHYNTTTYDGGGVCRSILYDSDLKYNEASSFGGGASRSSLSNCTLHANNSDYGGGCYWSTLNNCIIQSNVAQKDGGGACLGTLEDCDIIGNQSWEDGGGASGSVLSNCLLNANKAIANGGAASGGSLYDCVLLCNTTTVGSLSGDGGGGGHECNMQNCSIISNVCTFADGGGAYDCILSNCYLMGNNANNGGGAIYSELCFCCLVENVANSKGGGVYDSTLINSLISCNESTQEGGGGYGGAFSNCTIVRNTGSNGGGIIAGLGLREEAMNCIVWGNHSTSNMYNDICIKSLVYSLTVNNTCASDGITNGVNGCITNNPIFMDAANSNFQLQASSPCINAGDNAYAPTNVTPYDLAGNPRIIEQIVDMGAYEYQGSTPENVTLEIVSAHGSPMPSGGSHEYESGAVVTNSVASPVMDGSTQYVCTGWTIAGNVPLSGTNNSFVMTITNDAVVTWNWRQEHSGPMTYYVDASRPDDSGDGTSWATAKKIIQSAVDLAVDGDTVLVTNGMYDVGGKTAPGYALTNRVCITRPITLQSVNGPEVTVIEGAPGSNGSNDVDSIRCVYMTNGCSLIGFTVTNGSTFAGTSQEFESTYGGGIRMLDGCLVSNCVISGNTSGSWGAGISANMDSRISGCLVTGNKVKTALYDNGGGGIAANNTVIDHCVVRDNSGARYGGGVLLQSSTIYNSLVTGNKANLHGGGILLGWFGSARIINCTIVSNEAFYGFGGGVSLENGGGDEIHNSVVYDNLSTQYPEKSDISDFGGSLIYNTCAGAGECLTNGVNGCITNNPLFINAANGNYQLQSNSPCINTGDNTYAPTNVTPYDLAGNPRIVEQIVDMGAYEYQFKTPQTISFADIAPRIYGAEAFDAGATASSGLPVSYALSDADVATNAGAMIYIVGVGTCDVTASQAGNDEYAAAADVVHTLTVSQKAVTVTGAVAQNKEYDGTTAATITGGALSGVVGADDVSLANAATGTFASANIGTNIVVTSYMTLAGSDSANYTLSQPTLAADITRKTQTITFTQIPQQMVTNTVTLEATTDSSLPLTFAVASGSAQINGSNLVFSYAGDVAVTCSQEGDATWQPAAVTNTFTVLPLMPAVVTHDASKVDNFTFTAGGEVTSDGQGLTSRGICWATNTVPTVNDFKTVNGSGTGVYVSVAGSLLRNTKYYFRAYANNASGVTYGDEMMVTTSNQATSLDFLLLLLPE